MGSPGFRNHNNGQQQQRLGITEPISLGGPTEYDVIKTRELEKYLQDAGLYENQQEAVSREEVLGRLDQVTGFLGGINWALLVALICQLFPNALPNMLVSRFFRVYTKWRWPNPVMLCAIEEGSLGLQVWDPRRYPKDRFHLMPIITPAYPCMNSSYNVSSSTLRIMMQEFQRGNEVCEAMEADKADWDTLFEPYPFFEAYKNYLQIDISAENADDLRKWKGWVESRLRQLTLKIERHTYGMLQCHPHPGDFPDKSRPFHCSYFTGLQRKQGVPVNGGERFDIRLTVEEFKHSVNMYTLWKPGMDIHVSHVKRRGIPTFVFPGGVRPSHPSKVTWESKRSSELSISGHDQEEQSQEGEVAVLGANDDRKRKLAGDSVDSLRNFKSLASLPPSSREVHEDGNPVSIDSGCYVKYIGSEINSTSEQQSEKPDLESTGECPGDWETNGSSNSKDAEKPAIEKIMCGPYDAQHVFPAEPDELEDEFEYRNQVRDFGENVKNSNLDSSNSETVVAAEPIIPKKETASATCLYSTGGSEELEPEELTAPFLSGITAPVPQQKPLIRLKFTSLGKAAD